MLSIGPNDLGAVRLTMPKLSTALPADGPLVPKPELLLTHSKRSLAGEEIHVLATLGSSLDSKALVAQFKLPVSNKTQPTWQPAQALESTDEVSHKTIVIPTSIPGLYTLALDATACGGPRRLYEFEVTQSLAIQNSRQREQLLEITVENKSDTTLLLLGCSVPSYSSIGQEPVLTAPGDTYTFVFTLQAPVSRVHQRATVEWRRAPLGTSGAVELDLHL